MQTTVKEIYKGFSNQVRIPYTIARYACGHGKEMPCRDPHGNRHAPDNWLLELGAALDCRECDDNRLAAERIIAFAKTPEFSHVTLRDMTASKTGEWMAFCVYQIDPSSPTQCKLALSVEATSETERMLVEAGVSFIPGPSRGRMAMG